MIWNHIVRFSCCLLLAAAALPAQKPTQSGEFILYAGTYTGPKSKGIYAFRFDPASGKTVPIGLVAETTSPSFLALHPTGRYLYAVNESSNSISAFSVDAKTGALAFLNKVASGGSAPCHLTLDRTSKWLLAANYGSGSVAVFPIKTDGSLGDASSVVQHSGSSVNLQRQRGPHAHEVVLSPDNRFALVADLGLDQVLIYRFDAVKGALTPNDPAFAKLSPGSGPRHLVFHPNGRFVYVISEIKSTMTAFAYDAARGSLQELQTVSTLPQGFTGTSSAAEVQVHANGKFLYGSNRGHDSIAAFAIDPAKGTLTPAGHTPTQGKNPRHFAIGPFVPSYLFAANQNSDNIVQFRIDSNTGTLTPTGTVLDVPAPVCVTFFIGQSN
jgi:6-phosphogluconolactonase